MENPSQWILCMERTKDSSAHHKISPTLFFHDCLGGNLVRNFEKSLKKSGGAMQCKKAMGCHGLG